MGKKLVVVESPAKAKTINKMLGKDFVVSSSMGHVRDLPQKQLGVDIEHGFEPKYVQVKGRKKVVEELKRLAKDADAIYLAPDPDREGEAIAWHLQQLLDDGSGKDVYRVQYNEITPSAVNRAFENPGRIDMHRVDAQQARRVLDRIVGYKVSPVLWRRVRRGLSAGRVQSVALRLVCEREQEIRNFKAQEYWVLGALVRKLVVPLEPFSLKLIRIGGDKVDVRSEEQVRAIRSELEGRALRVQAISTRTIHKRPPPPFITSTLQQAGSSSCGYSPQRTMSLAQRLYEGLDLGQGPVGLITYMRTDSVAVSRDAIEQCRNFISKKYGRDYCPETANIYKSRASAQEAHEAIRPTDVTRTPESLGKRLDSAELKIYRLIWQRFVASQMAPASIEQRTVKVEALSDANRAREFLFQASASDVRFPGYMKVTKPSRPAIDKQDGGGEKPTDGHEVQRLPDLKEGEPLMCLEWLGERKETQPPPRFSEAALVRVLESKGVGRPSTYAQILSTLDNRKYVTRQKRMLAPTELGLKVNRLLVHDLGELFDVAFTAEMEQKLDAVEEGKVEWTEMLQRFYSNFETWMENTKEPPADREAVGRLLDALQGVQVWKPEVKRGKRTYSDEKFVTSLREQYDGGEKPLSQRQFLTLARIACHYLDQVETLKPTLEALGFEELLHSPEAQPPTDATREKLEMLSTLNLPEGQGDFVNSLAGRVASGRCLTEAQVRALNNVVLSHAKQLDGLDEKRERLGLGEQDEVDPAVPRLLEALEQVSTWREPVKRGRRSYDDAAFFTSLRSQFASRGSLSVRQVAALKNLLKRYREQIEGYAELSRELGLDTPADKSARRGK